VRPFLGARGTALVAQMCRTQHGVLSPWQRKLLIDDIQTIKNRRSVLTAGRFNHDDWSSIIHPYHGKVVLQEKSMVNCKQPFLHMA
jgi:hypothetical protein